MTCTLLIRILLLVHGTLTPPQIFTSLWEKFAALIPGGDLYFHDEVRKELDAWSSAQSTWFHNHVPQDRIICTNQAELDRYVDVAHWAQFLRDPPYKQKAIDDFLRVADSWLVASALAHGATMVSDVKSAKASTNRFKIPDAAEHFGVPYLDFLGFLKEKKLSF